MRDKRRNQRKPIERKAWIDREDGSPMLQCVIGNMSDTGAKLVFSASPTLPESFILRLTGSGNVARKCRLAWKSGNEIGVEFVARLVTATPTLEAAET